MKDVLLVLFDQMVGPSVPRILCPLYDRTVGAAAHAVQERWQALADPWEREVVDEITLPVLPLDPGAPVIPLRRSE